MNLMNGYDQLNLFVLQPCFVGERTLPCSCNLFTSCASYPNFIPTSLPSLSSPPSSSLSCPAFLSCPYYFVTPHIPFPDCIRTILSLIQKWTTKVTRAGPRNPARESELRRTILIMLVLQVWMKRDPGLDHLWPQLLPRSLGQTGSTHPSVMVTRFPG